MSSVSWNERRNRWNTVCVDVCLTCWVASDLAGELSSISQTFSGSDDLQHTLLGERGGWLNRQAYFQKYSLEDYHSYTCTYVCTSKVFAALEFLSSTLGLSCLLLHYTPNTHMHSTHVQYTNTHECVHTYILYMHIQLNLNGNIKGGRAHMKEKEVESGVSVGREKQSPELRLYWMTIQ